MQISFLDSDHLQEAGSSAWSLAKGQSIRMIICKRPVHLDDHLQEAFDDYCCCCCFVLEKKNRNLPFRGVENRRQSFALLVLKPLKTSERMYDFVKEIRDPSRPKILIQGSFFTVLPNFQYQNEKPWAANQRFCSMKFSMYKSW